MTSVCACKYPVHMIDKRGEDTIEYLAMPIVTIDEMGEIPVPTMSSVERKDLNGIMRKYVKVSWFPTIGAHTKEYEIIPHDGKSTDVHIMVVGCDNPTIDSKCKLKDRSKCKPACVDKTVYEVYHPREEWNRQHIVTVR